MIAKVTTSGADVGGLIEYLYDGREEKRKRNDKKAEVIGHSENIQMPRDAQDLAGRKALADDFDNRAKSYGKPFKYVGMHVISFTKEDMKKLDKAQLRQICAEYVEMAGLHKTQYFAVAHHDTDHYHVHFVFNRINNRGVKMDTHYEKLNTSFRGVALSLNYGLKLKGESFKIGQTYKIAALRHQHPAVLALVDKDKTGLLKTAKSLNHLKKMAAEKGIKVYEYWSQDKARRAQGLKIGDIPLEERASFNCTKIGEIEYRNEDLRAIFYRNSTGEKQQILDSKEEKRKYQEWNFGMEVPEVKFGKSTDEYRFIKNFGPIKNRGSETHRPNKKIAEHELKIQKIAKQRGIKL